MLDIRTENKKNFLRTLLVVVGFSVFLTPTFGQRISHGEERYHERFRQLYEPYVIMQGLTPQYLTVKLQAPIHLLSPEFRRDVALINKTDERRTTIVMTDTTLSIKNYHAIGDSIVSCNTLKSRNVYLSNRRGVEGVPRDMRYDLPYLEGCEYTDSSILLDFGEVTWFYLTLYDRQGGTSTVARLRVMYNIHGRHDEKLFHEKISKRKLENLIETRMLKGGPLFFVRKIWSSAYEAWHDGMKPGNTFSNGQCLIYRYSDKGDTLLVYRDISFSGVARSFGKMIDTLPMLRHPNPALGTQGFYLIRDNMGPRDLNGSTSYAIKGPYIEAVCSTVPSVSDTLQTLYYIHTQNEKELMATTTYYQNRIVTEWFMNEKILRSQEIIFK